MMTKHLTPHTHPLLQTPYQGGNVCPKCVCSSCTTPLPVAERILYGAGIFCNTCVCKTCSKPATEVRGELVVCCV